jgi:ribonuclease-3
MNEQERLELLEERIGYTFRDKTLLRTALTHSSYAHERKINKVECNERLEFLGDAVLEQISSDYIYRHHPKMPEGQMSKLRASLVCETALAECAKKIGLGELLFLGRGEEGSGGRTKPSVTSDAYEAVIGAMYLDGGIEPARKFVEREVLSQEAMDRVVDAKTALQELAQSRGMRTATYILLEERGPEHDKEFSVAVQIAGEELGRGIGRNKKSAEKAAAAVAL